MWAKNARLIMLGAGGHATVVQDLVRALGAEIDGFVAPNPQSRLDGVRYLGSEMDFDPGGVLLLNGIGSVSAPVLRRELYIAATARGFTFATLVDPGAHVRTSALLGEGAQILPGAVLGSGVVLHENVIVNSGSVIEHGTTVGAHSHISPGVAISGDVAIGESVHVGVGATIVQGIRIGANSTIGAGAVVIKDVPPGAVAIGVPARTRKAESHD